MKLNIDCVRDMLLVLEKLEYHEAIKAADLHAKLPEYSPEDVHYVAEKLAEGGLITAVIQRDLSGCVALLYVEDITYAGHQLLNDIRPKERWDKVKDAVLKVGGASIPIIHQIAGAVLLAQFGFTS